MKIGITGHQNLANPTWVKLEISRILHLQPIPLIGISSLAIGADQLFAQAILDCGGALQVIVPFDKYTEVFEADGLKGYNRLLSDASLIETLSLTGSHEEAFFTAGKRVVDTAELVIAVWNGKPAAGLGGTADVVEYAKIQRKPYIHINPLSRKTDWFLYEQQAT